MRRAERPVVIPQLFVTNKRMQYAVIKKTSRLIKIDSLYYLLHTLKKKKRILHSSSLPSWPPFHPSCLQAHFIDTWLQLYVLRQNVLAFLLSHLFVPCTFKSFIPSLQPSFVSAWQPSFFQTHTFGTSCIHVTTHRLRNRFLSNRLKQKQKNTNKWTQEILIVRNTKVLIFIG